jgi:hypothetical protein
MVRHLATTGASLKTAFLDEPVRIEDMCSTEGDVRIRSGVEYEERLLD